MLSDIINFPTLEVVKLPCRGGHEYTLVHDGEQGRVQAIPLLAFTTQDEASAALRTLRALNHWYGGGEKTPEKNPEA